MHYFLIVIIVIAVFFFFWQKKRAAGGGKSRARALRKEYGRKARLPLGQEDEYIDSYISRLEEKYPGRSEVWYLEKMLFDLERDL